MMIVASLEKISTDGVAEATAPAVVRIGEPVRDMTGRAVGKVARTGPGGRLVIKITDRPTLRKLLEGIYNAVAVDRQGLVIVDNPEVMKAAGGQIVWKVAKKVSNQSIGDQLKSIAKTLERLAERTGGPRVPDRRASAGSLAATRHGSPSDIAQALGLADNEAAREKLAHMLIAASGATRPRFSRPMSPTVRPTVSKMSEAEADSVAVKMIGSMLRERPEQVMRAPRRSPEQLAKVADVVRPLSREEREKTAVELIRHIIGRR